MQESERSLLDNIGLVEQLLSERGFLISDEDRRGSICFDGPVKPLMAELTERSLYIQADQHFLPATDPFRDRRSFSLQISEGGYRFTYLDERWESDECLNDIGGTDSTYATYGSLDSLYDFYFDDTDNTLVIVTGPEAGIHFTKSEISTGIYVRGAKPDTTVFDIHPDSRFECSTFKIRFEITEEERSSAVAPLFQ